MAKERIQKMLAEAGVASRREAEELVLEGRVTVNGRVVVSVPCFVDPVADEVRVDGQPVRMKAVRQTYILVNKPTGVTCAFHPASGRSSVFDLIPPGKGPLHCVAPLNASEGGLVLLTSDGQLAQELRHPRYRLEKTYYVEVEGRMESGAIERLKRGVKFGRWRTEEATARIIRRETERTVMEIRVAEAKNGELRKILLMSGHKIRHLRRTALGPLTERGVKVGTWRRLSPAEVTALREAIWRR
jgi:23S rRNA pseudouridine2605 synthase